MFRVPDYGPRIRRFEMLEERLRLHVERRLFLAERQGEAIWVYPPNLSNHCSNPYCASAEIWLGVRGSEGWAFSDPKIRDLVLRWKSLWVFVNEELGRMRLTSMRSN